MNSPVYVIYHATTIPGTNRPALVEVKRYRQHHRVGWWINDHPDADVWVHYPTRWQHREHSEYSATETMGADPAVVRLFKQSYERAYTDAEVRSRFDVLNSVDPA